MLIVERWVKHCTFKHDFVTFHTGVKSRKKNNSENSSFTCRRHVCVMVLSFSFVISCFTHHFLSYFFQTPFLCRPGYVLPISTFVFKFVLQPLLVCLCFFFWFVLIVISSLCSVLGFSVACLSVASVFVTCPFACILDSGLGLCY